MVKSVEAIVVQIEPRKNSRVGCSGCGRTASGYDHMSEARHFEFVPLWGMKVMTAACDKVIRRFRPQPVLSRRAYTQ